MYVQRRRQQATVGVQTIDHMTGRIPMSAPFSSTLELVLSLPSRLAPAHAFAAGTGHTERKRQASTPGVGAMTGLAGRRLFDDQDRLPTDVVIAIRIAQALADGSPARPRARADAAARLDGGDPRMGGHFLAGQAAHSQITAAAFVGR